MEKNICFSPLPNLVCSSLSSQHQTWRRNSGYINISAPHDNPSRPVNPQVPNLQRCPTYQQRSQILILLSKVIRHNEITPGFFILQLASASLSLYNLALNAANAETPIPTATTAHHSSSSYNLQANVCSAHILHSR